VTQALLKPNQAIKYRDTDTWTEPAQVGSACECPAPGVLRPSGQAIKSRDTGPLTYPRQVGRA